MAKRSKVERARRSIRVTVTKSPGDEMFKHIEKLAAVGPRARQLLPVNLGTACAV
jgi:hypothetical protein